MNKTEKNMQSKNTHAQALGKLGGLVKSDKKAESSRLNGKKGGRPKKPPTKEELKVLESK